MVHTSLGEGFGVEPYRGRLGLGTEVLRERYGVVSPSIAPDPRNLPEKQAFGRHTWIELALGFSYCELLGFYGTREESGRVVALGQAFDGVAQVGERGQCVEFAGGNDGIDYRRPMATGHAAGEHPGYFARSPRDA